MRTFRTAARADDPLAPVRFRSNTMVADARTILRFVEERVLAMKDGFFESTFAEVIVQRRSGLAEKKRESIPAFRHVGDRGAGTGVWLDAVPFDIHRVSAPASPRMRTIAPACATASRACFANSPTSCRTASISAEMISALLVSIRLSSLPRRQTDATSLDQVSSCTLAGRTQTFELTFIRPGRFGFGKRWC